MTSDDRFTRGLITGVFDVLERQAFGMVLDLAHIYESARNTSHGPYLQPARSSPPPREAG